MKITMTILLPFIIAWSVISRIYSEVKDVPFYVLHDVREIIKEYKETMKE